jgi:hypothetical protein
VLINRGLAAWNSDRDPARGCSLTRPGKAVMRHFAQSVEYHSPTLKKR